MRVVTLFGSISGETFIVQAMQETVQARRKANIFRAFQIRSKGQSLSEGLSINRSNLALLTLGVDRDSAVLAPPFDKQNEAVKWMIAHVISAAKQAGAKIGLGGEAPSDHPAFAEFPASRGIHSISVSPIRLIAVKLHVAKAEIEKAETEKPWQSYLRGGPKQCSATPEFQHKYLDGQRQIILLQYFFLPSFERFQIEVSDGLIEQAVPVDLGP
jgi:hypothetical protein